MYKLGMYSVAKGDSEESLNYDSKFAKAYLRYVQACLQLAEVNEIKLRNGESLSEDLQDDDSLKTIS